MEDPAKKDGAVNASSFNNSNANQVTVATVTGEINRRSVENPNRQITDYNLMRVIGTGTFGKVYLALLDGQPMALKALKKTQIINLKQVDHIKLEKSLLAQIYHPFIVNL